MSRPGDKYRISEGYDRLNEAHALNREAGEHLWVILVSYGLTAEEAAVSSEGISQILDPEHLLAVSSIGCYICEKSYQQVVGQECVEVI